jgi:hypothetical protein
MKFRIQMTPMDLPNMPEHMQAQILEQLPKQLHLERQRLENAEAMLREAQDRHRQWQRLAETPTW